MYLVIASHKNVFFHFYTDKFSISTRAFKKTLEMAKIGFKDYKCSAWC